MDGQSQSFWHHLISCYPKYNNASYSNPELALNMEYYMILAASFEISYFASIYAKNNGTNQH